MQELGYVVFHIPVNTCLARLLAIFTLRAAEEKSKGLL